MTLLQNNARDDAAWARRLFNALPDAPPPGGLMERIERGVQQERARRRTLLRGGWALVAAITLLAAAIPLTARVSPQREVSQARIQQTFHQWDAEYQASQTESDTAFLAALTPVDALLTEDGKTPAPTEPDPLAPIVGF
ncbi:MAG: hypothetical protein IPK79_07765 [Vampirovibrionales bacterium]|nr:hypothetical protein [Vampirovibrionales bacterium]